MQPGLSGSLLLCSLLTAATHYSTCWLYFCDCRLYYSDHAAGSNCRLSCQCCLRHCWTPPPLRCAGCLALLPAAHHSATGQPCRTYHCQAPAASHYTAQVTCSCTPSLLRSAHNWPRKELHTRHAACIISWAAAKRCCCKQRALAVAAGCCCCSDRPPAASAPTCIHCCVMPVSRTHPLMG